MLDKSLSAVPDTGETPTTADLPGMWEAADYTGGLDEVRPVTAAPGTATAAQVWAYLGNAPEAHNLPAPTQISVHEHKAALIYLQYHTLTDLYTWVAWLGAGDLTTRVYDALEPGYVMRATDAKTTWRGWTIEITLLQAMPVETVAVSFGQTTPPLTANEPTSDTKCATTFGTQAGPCDGPANMQVTYRSKKDYDRILNVTGPVCRAHAQHESNCAFATGLIAPHSIDPWNGQTAGAR